MIAYSRSGWHAPNEIAYTKLNYGENTRANKKRRFRA